MTDRFAPLGVYHLVLRAFVTSSIVALLVACTPRSPEPTKDVAIAAAPTIVPAPIAGPAAPVAAPPLAPVPVPEVAVVGESVEEMLQRLAARMTKSPEPLEVAAGLVELGLRSDAETFFAQASLADREAWKPPYDLARMAAKTFDDGVVQLALHEAVRRGGTKTASRARHDPYFELDSGKPWFADVLAMKEAPPLVMPPGTVDEVAAPSAPALLAVRELPKGKTQPIAKAELASIVAALTQQYLATPTIFASLVHTDGSGNTLRWVVYEYSLFDACMATQSDPKEGKRACRAKVATSPGAAQRHEQGIALVTSVDPVIIAHDERIDVTAKLRKVPRLEVADYDGDGADEILVELRGRYTEPEGEIAEMTEHRRTIRILRSDASTQLAFDVSYDEDGMGAARPETARQLVHSRAADSHDLVVLARNYETGEGALDKNLWPDDDTTMLGPLTTTLMPYDATTDTWLATR